MSTSFDDPPTPALASSSSFIFFLKSLDRLNGGHHIKVRVGPQVQRALTRLYSVFEKNILKNLGLDKL